MKAKLFLSVMAFLCLTSIAAVAKTEQAEIAERLKNFYNHPTDPRVMNVRPLKRLVETGEIVQPNSVLRFAEGESPKNAFEDLAQQKSTAVYQDKYCKVLKKQFPKIQCPGESTEPTAWAGVEANDRVADLGKSWIENTESRMDRLPSYGTTKLSLWSDDYWRTKWGATSYRYSKGVRFPTYKEAVDSYVQPREWIEGLKNVTLPELSKVVTAWSPAEKYDLTVGDAEFSLSNEQKEEGASLLGADGDVEAWMGICHGWAAAAIVAPKANLTTEVTGATGIKLTWYPHDVRAITSLAWANGYHSNNFVGGRCGKKKPEVFANGRLKDQECFDTNPATFHMALGNLIGRQGASFVIDAAYDYEVWNQPVESYEFVYFNPLDTTKQSKNWQEVAVDYDAAFKLKDRFQQPLTRGILAPNTGVYDDKAIKKVVGVLAKIVYLGEVIPVHTTTPRSDQLIRVTYNYDLELTEEGGEMVISGGEWQTNAHPDFLWVPRKNAVATMPYDRQPLGFTGNELPNEITRRTATGASRYGYPLCGVVSELLKRSAPGSNYPCPSSD